MNWLIFANGTEQPTKAVGRRYIVPMRIQRERSKYWEIADAIFEGSAEGWGSLTYRESYWEIPRPNSYVTHDGKRVELREPGVYYYPG